VALVNELQHVTGMELAENDVYELAEELGIPNPLVLPLSSDRLRAVKLASG
jgi:hypothetical protein